MKSKHTIEQARALQNHKLKCKYFKISASYDEDVVYPAMDTYAKQQAEAVIKELEEINGVIGTPHLNHAINLIKKHFNIV